MDEFKKSFTFAMKMEGIKGPSGPLELHSFAKPESIEDCKIICDTEIGGESESKLDWIPPEETDAAAMTSGGHARFHGTISTKLPDRADVLRTGYAAWRTADRGPTIFGRSLWNIDQYAFLALRVKSDGRKYFINLQTDSIVTTDIHQHRLFANRPGEWETVLLQWNDFVRTNHGVAVEPQTELLRQKVKSIGFGLTDRKPGPFEICVGRIWATNNVVEKDEQELSSLVEGELKNKDGKRLRWTNEEEKVVSPAQTERN